MKLPNELELCDDAGTFRVRFDYDRGEPERWNGLTGVGNPEIPPSVEITEIQWPGCAWQPVEAFPQLNIEQCEQEVMDSIIDLEDAEQEARAYADEMRREERRAEWHAEMRRDAFGGDA